MHPGLALGIVLILSLIITLLILFGSPFLIKAITIFFITFLVVGFLGVMIFGDGDYD